jgi:cytochrome-b5 reductase
MTAGGTGITPIFQLIQSVCLNGDDVELTLLFGNQTEDDILIKKELDELAQKYPNKFKLYYIVDRVLRSDTWKGDSGYISKELIQK